jgi:signal transduction histidine kinase
MRRHASSFSSRRLQTKLAVASMFVTAGTIVILLLVVMVGAVANFVTTFANPAFLAQDAQPFLPVIEFMVRSDDPESGRALQKTLDAIRAQQVQEIARGVALDLDLAVVDSDNRVIAASPKNVDLATMSQGEPSRGIVVNAGGISSPPSIVRFELGPGASQGMFLIRARGTLQPRFVLSFLQEISPIAAAVLILGSFTAVGIGSFVARRLTDRLGKIERVTNAWRRGEFEQRVPDADSDELGALGEVLNNMADDMQELLRDRARSASALERDRWARELHDTVKQQAFAASMHLAIAQRQIAEGVDASEDIAHAAKLVETMRRDLAAMLDPAPKTEGNAAIGLRIIERGERWSKRTGIALHSEVDIRIEVPGSHVHHVVRIVDEALANVERHSRANNVVINLQQTDGWTELRVADDGVGMRRSDQSAGMGLSNMRVRAAELPDGDITFSSGPGTSILLRWRRNDAGS